MSTDPIVGRYLAASADLVQNALSQVQESDAEATAGLARLLGAGGMVSLRATFAPRVGVALASVFVVEPSGDEHQLMHIELRRDTQQ